MERDDKNKYLFKAEKRNICVMFSGGYDSTLLLIKALEMKRDNLVHEVYATYVDCSNIPNFEKQKVAMNNILKELKGQICGCQTNTVKIDLTSTSIISRIQSGQMMMFLPTCLMGIPDNTEIWFGMIDHTTMTNSVSLKAKERVMNGIVSELSKHFSMYNDIVVKCPIMEYGDSIETRKTFIIENLLDYEYVFDLCFSCDNNYSSQECECLKHHELLVALMNVYRNNHIYYTHCIHGDMLKTGCLEKAIYKMNKIRDYIQKHYTDYYSTLESLTSKEKLEIKDTSTDK